MPHDIGRNGPIPNIIANLDELEGFNPELAAKIRHQEEEHLRLLNEALRGMSAEEIIGRLKGVMWRLLPTLRLSEMVQLDFGGEVLSVSLRSSLTALTDAIKWIGWAHGVDPMSAFGDDTMVVALRDMTLGRGPSASQDPSYSTADGLRGVAQTIGDARDEDDEI